MHSFSCSNVETIAALDIASIPKQLTFCVCVCVMVWQYEFYRSKWLFTVRSVCRLAISIRFNLLARKNEKKKNLNQQKQEKTDWIIFTATNKHAPSPQYRTQLPNDWCIFSCYKKLCAHFFFLFISFFISFCCYIELAFYSGRHWIDCFWVAAAVAVRMHWFSMIVLNVAVFFVLFFSLFFSRSFVPWQHKVLSQIVNGKEKTHSRN